MPHSQPAPTRTLGEQPSLEQLRKQAKELLKAHQQGDAAAVAEVARFERHPDPASFALADAQRVLARAYGFASWTKLKQHVEGVNVERFCAAVEQGDIAAVRNLARSRPELVRLHRDGEKTALHFAVLARNAEMSRVLMELGADARQGVWPHRDATSPLTIAQERGYDEIVAIIDQAEAQRRRALSDPGATIDTRAERIHQAILAGRDDEAIEIISADRWLVNACDVRGAAPLHVAAAKHNPQLIARLVAHGANVNATDQDGKTPLDYAALVAGRSSHGRDFSFLENSKLDPARFDETVRLLRGGGAQLTPRAAVAIGDEQAIRRLHAAGQLENEIHFYRGGLLSIAVRVNRRDMVELLLDLGLDPDESAVSDDGDRSGGMPLWFAAMCGRCDIAELLLDRGADVNAIVHACGDALSIADTTEDEPMQALLLSRGARLTVERVAGCQDRQAAAAILAGELAAQSLNVEEPTLTDLAEQMLWAAGSSDPEIVRMCLSHISRRRDDPWWNYVLMHATLPESFRLVLEHGVDPNVAGDGGYTMLHHLATVKPYAHPARRQISEPERLELAAMLLDKGASLTLRDPLLLSTPLGWACRWGRAELAGLLLDRGADPLEADAEPWARPLAWGEKGGHTEIIALLQRQGMT